MVPRLLQQLAESQKTSGGDFGDCDRILIGSQKIVRRDQLVVFSGAGKDFLRKRAMDSRVATKRWVGIRVEGSERSSKSLDDIEALGRQSDHFETLAHSRPTDRVTQPKQGCDDRPGSWD